MISRWSRGTGRSPTITPRTQPTPTFWPWKTATPARSHISAGDPLTLEDLFGTAEEITGVPAPRPVNPGLFSVLASLMGVVERVVTPPEGLEAEAPEFLSGNGVGIDNSKAKRELGIEHRPVADGLRDYFEWEQTQTETDFQIT